MALDPASPAARLALSYAQQATRDLPAALESAREATRLADDNALAWARRAELELATADAAAGAASARK
ncbi:hypothetical protein, partial [Zoogloea sp.]|uniref:hypothetical protein n=1 Tax=Zoogloea sp. TaxID=49181 RepID=UPI0026341E67